MTGNKDLRSGLQAISLKGCGLVVALLVCLSLGCCAGSVPSPLMLHTQSLQSLYPEALKMAKEWQQDAYLISARTDFAVNDVDADLSASFFFLSDTYPWTMLHISNFPTLQFSSEEVSIPGLNRAENPAILDSEWPVDSIDALEIAQDSGGADFLQGRSTHDLYLYLKLEKQAVEDGFLTVWFAYYHDRTDKEALCLTIDAVTGQVVGRECK